MRGTFNRGLLIAGLCVGMLFCSAVQASAQNVNGEILRRMSVHNKALQSLKADVTFVKYDAVLKINDTTTGEVTYIPEHGKHQLMMRLDWKTENGRAKNDSLAIKDGKFTLYQPRLNEVITGPTQKGKGSQEINNIFGFMSMPQGQLREKYSVAYIGEEQVKGGQNTWHLELTPKIKMSYKSADLWVDADGMPRQVRMVAPNNDTTTILLSNLHKNETVKTSIFTIDYDKKKVKVTKK